MARYANILETIGNTPVVKIGKLAPAGMDLYVKIEAFNPLFTYLTPVMKNLSDPNTELDEFFKQLGGAAKQVAPVADVQAQLFVNLANNARLDSRGFTPVGRVVDGLARVDAFHGGYGDGPPAGRGPDQDRMAAEGNEYLLKYYPRLDYVRAATIVRESKKR